MDDEGDKPEADVAEQEAVVEEDQIQLPVDTSGEGSEGDRIEQAIEVPLHEEEEVR